METKALEVIAQRPAKTKKFSGAENDVCESILQMSYTMDEESVGEEMITKDAKQQNRSYR